MNVDLFTHPFGLGGGIYLSGSNQTFTGSFYCIDPIASTTIVVETTLQNNYGSTISATLENKPFLAPMTSGSITGECIVYNANETVR
jgi:hypothetical protein